VNSASLNHLQNGLECSCQAADKKFQKVSYYTNPDFFTVAPDQVQNPAQSSCSHIQSLTLSSLFICQRFRNSFPLDLRCFKNVNILKRLHKTTIQIGFLLTLLHIVWYALSLFDIVLCFCIIFIVLLIFR